MSRSLRYKSFCLGIVVTTVTWVIVLYLYVNLNRGGSDSTDAYNENANFAHSQNPTWKLQGSPSRFQKDMSKKTWFGKHKEDLRHGLDKHNMHKSPNNFEDYDSNHINVIGENGAGNYYQEGKLKNVKKQNLAVPAIANLENLEELGLVRSRADQLVRNEGYRLHVFNLLISNRIGNRRDIPDTRHSMCKSEKYRSNLPTVSVIICFFNEAKSALLRTVHTVLDRSPPHLLQEIILVDDESTLDDLKEDLELYLRNLPSKIIIFRTGKREGLIRARMHGARQATGEVLVFLDSHCEVNVHWLEPLLARIAEDRTAVVCPIIDIINADTFSYTSSPLVRGGFNWGLHFKWDSIPRTYSEPEDYIKPISSPTMAGGLFAIQKSYFTELGEYDPGMDIWGGENLEISFRVWMCGGHLEIIPCSRVGHIFRKRRPYGSPSGQDTMLHNSLRVARVWMDEYKEYFFETRPDARAYPYGNITDRVELRKKLKCNSFKWYLENVYPELKLPSEQGDNKKPNPSILSNKKEGRIMLPWKKRVQNFIGQFRIQLSDTKLCLESEEDPTTKGSLLLIRPCRKSKSQVWFETDKHELLLAELLCLDASDEIPRLSKCHNMGGTQEWKHNSKTNTGITFYNVAAGLCLGVKGRQDGDYTVMEMCTKPAPTLWDMVEVKGRYR